jgi:hypothetical protein
MPSIKPFRDVSEHSVINLFAYHGASLAKGSVVKILSGLNTTDDPQQFAGPVGASYTNTVSERWTLWPRLALADTGAAGVPPLGITLYEVAEVDENGLPLKFNPTKAAEMQVALSGQAVPVATEGLFLYSGISGANYTAGALAYAAPGGEISPTGYWQVGKFLGPRDTNGWAYVLFKF